MTVKLVSRTRGNSSPQGKPRVYLTAHPEDYGPFLQSMIDDIHKTQNCVIYYDEEPWKPLSEEDLALLAGMQLFVIPVTRRFLTEPNRAREVEFPFATERDDPIPVLPLMQEPGLEQLFNEKCGALQTIGRDEVVDREKALAGKVRSYEEKLAAYLDSVLVGDELIAQIRGAFDAYIFLSYRKIDRDDAQKLMRLIHGNDFCRDIAIWYDEFLVPGRDFGEAIQDAMEKSKLFVLTVTPNVLSPGPDGGPNFVMGQEYPRARETGKPVFPVMMQPTDRDALRSGYEQLPDCADPQDAERFRTYLLDTVRRLAIKENDRDPRHNFFIGLAYLNGIDVEKDVDRALELITGAAEAGLPEAHEQLAKMYRTGNGVRRDYRKAIEWQKKLVSLYDRRIREENDPEAPGELVMASWRLGDYCMELPDFSEALDAYSISLQTCKAIIQAGENAWRDLEGLTDDPAAFMEATVWAARGSGAQKTLPMCYDNLGDALRCLGRLEEARSCYESGLPFKRDVFRKESSEGNRRELFLSLQRLGDLCLRTGDAAGARDCYQEMEALAREGVPRRDEMLSYNKRGDELLAQNDLAQAEVYFRRQYDLARQLYDEFRNDETREDLCAACGRLAQVCWSTQRLEEAERYARESLECAREWQESSESWPADYQVSIAYEHLGRIYWIMDKLPEAEQYFLESLTLRRRLYARQPTLELLKGLMAVCWPLGNMLLGQRRFKAARSCGIEMFDAAREAGDEENMDAALFLLYKVAALWQASAADLINEQRCEEARDALVEARELGKFLLEETGRPVRNDQGEEIPLRPLAALIQQNLWAVHLNLGDFERAAQAGYRSGNLFTKLWNEYGDPAYGESAAQSWRNLVRMYMDRDNLELAAYYANQAAGMSDELYRKTGELKYLAILAEDCFQIGSLHYNQSKWQEAFQWYLQASGVANKYCTDSGDRSQEKLILACKCAYYMGHASWELQNFEDARQYLGAAVDWSFQLSEEPDGFVLPPQAVGLACDRLVLLAERAGDGEKAAMYAGISYKQWKKAAEQSHNAFDYDKLANIGSKIAMSRHIAGLMEEAYSIWAELARAFPDEPRYAEERDVAKGMWEILKEHR